MSAQHTPGPWLVGKPYQWHGHGFMPVGIATEHSRGSVAVTVANVQPRYDNRSDVRWSDEDCANARLVAAAPDILDALADLVAFLDEDDAGSFMPVDLRAKLVKARAALTKANGR